MALFSIYQFTAVQRQHNEVSKMGGTCKDKYEYMHVHMHACIFSYEIHFSPGSQRPAHLWENGTSSKNSLRQRSHRGIAGDHWMSNQRNWYSESEDENSHSKLQSDWEKGKNSICTYSNSDLLSNSKYCDLCSSFLNIPLLIKSLHKNTIHKYVLAITIHYYYYQEV